MHYDAPSLEVTIDDGFIEEDEHGPLVLLLSNKPPEPNPTNVIPHLDVVGYRTLLFLESHHFRHIRFSRRVGVATCIDTVVIGNSGGCSRSVVRWHTHH